MLVNFVRFSIKKTFKMVVLGQFMLYVKYISKIGQRNISIIISN